jgi:large subunit ribosomal protein L22
VPETTQEVRAQAKWVRTSPRKARLVVEHIRGRSVPEARTVLAFTTRAAARDVEKVLRSAIANAEANHGFVGDDLYVSAAYVDEGPTLKRWRARARGRAARIRKPTCHITVELAPLAVEPKRPRPKTEAKPRPSAAEEAPAEKPPRKPRATKPKAEAEKPKRTRTPRRKKTEETES